jgi:beta-lactamase superfamily II metal-dependent hydrolase
MDNQVGRLRIRVTVSRVVDDDTVDVIAPSPGELFSETNDTSVASLLTYGTTCVLLTGDAEARGVYGRWPLHEA